MIILPSHHELYGYIRSISISQLGMILSKQGKHDEAEAMHRRVLQGYEKLLGQEQLASVLESLGKYDEAEAMHRRVLQGIPSRGFDTTSTSFMSMRVSSEGGFGILRSVSRFAVGDVTH